MVRPRVREAPAVCSSGISLIEVLVAMSVFAINLVAWHAALQIVFAMLRQMGVIEAQASDDATFATLCSAAVLLPRRLPRGVPEDLRRCNAEGVMRRGGLTIVEVLVTVAISAVILVLTVVTVAIVRRTTTTSLAESEAIVVKLALPALLHDVVGTAGRGVAQGAGTACAVGVEDDGQRLVVRFTEHSQSVEDHLFAARDHAGRPALYLRRLPHARQPWIEDVTDFKVVSVDDGLATWMRMVHVELGHAALESPLRVAIPLLHHPCIEGVTP